MKAQISPPQPNQFNIMTNHNDQLTTTLENDVRTLCLPEGRMVGTPGHATAEA